jgi:ferric-dicitrate binding protein FerR (iron transport regulator)
MFNRHVSSQLAAYADGQLSPRDAHRLERHLAGCPRCRAEQAQIRLAMSALTQVPVTPAPDAIWTAIEAALPKAAPSPRPRFRRAAFLWWKPALAAAALAAVLMTYRAVRPQHQPPLRVLDSVAAGQWIETDSSSSAQVKIAQIGSIEVAPNTRLRVVAERPDEHRLTLKRGQIHAKIFAPPKLFFVDTASATAEDLGCEYTLKTDEDGSGILHVTLGWVSFQWQGLESLVPAGASCRTWPRTGPGIPYFDDAPPLLQQALNRRPAIDSDSLGTILAAARIRDTLTLWNLIARVDARDRGRVIDRIAALTPLPAGISRGKAIELDHDTLTRWKDQLAWTW